MVFAGIGAVVGFVACGPECAVTGAVWGYAIGDSVGTAIEGRQNSAPPPPVPQIPSSLPPSPALGAGLGAFPGTSFAPLPAVGIAASETLQDSWGPDDAIYMLIGMGVAAKAAVVAARELGSSVLFGLRSLGETGAIRLGTGGGVEALAEAHITRSGRTVLGHFPEYIEKARARGASYFDIGKDAWNRLTDAERWGANQHFLDMIVSFRDRVLLSLPKGEIQSGTGLAREVAYLTKKKGYRWINQWALGPK